VIEVTILKEHQSQLNSMHMTSTVLNFRPKKLMLVFGLLLASWVSFASCSGTSTNVSDDTTHATKGGFVSPKASISVAEAHEWSKKGALIVDVREPDELAEMAYDVNSVVNIPLGSLENQLTAIPTDKQVIVVCRSGGRSGRAYELLKSKGYTNVANMEGGMNAWSASGLPTKQNGGN